VPEPYISTPFAVRRRWTRRPRVLSAGPCVRCASSFTTGRWWEQEDGTVICHECRILELQAEHSPEVVPDPGDKPRPCHNCGAESMSSRRLCNACYAAYRRAISRPNPRKLLVTPEQVRAMREEYRAGLGTIAALARKYGVSRNHAGGIIRRRSYTDVD
jgi:hypothetical protein